MTTEIRPSRRAVVPGVVLVEVLVTKGCPHEDAAVDLVAVASRDIGVNPVVMLIEVSNLDEATRQRFRGCPTIRVDGLDVHQLADDDAPSLSCRRGNTGHGLRGVPDYRQVRRALERGI